MNAITVGLVAVGLSTAAVTARDQVEADGDRAAIRQAAMDYAEGFYLGSVERMAKAVHPALLKRGLLPPGVPDRFLHLMNAETLIDLTDAQGGNPATNRQLDFAQLDLGDGVASARIFTERFNDYLHLVKQDDRWRIVNVLWQVPASAGSEQDKSAVASAIGAYYEGLWAGDAARVRTVVHPEFVRRTLRAGARGPLVLEDLNVDRLLGAVLLVAAQKGYAVGVVDVHDRIASAVVTQGHERSYAHLAKQNGRWRLVNMLSR